MRRRVMALSLLVLAVAVAGLGLARPGDDGPVYPLATVDAGLLRQPQAWVGRIVRVRGVINGTWCDIPAPCMRAQGGPDAIYAVAGGGRLVLDGGAATPGDGLPGPSLLLALGPRDPLLAALGHVPLIGGALAPTWHLRYGSVVVLRVRLHSRQCPFPWATRRWCAEGVVLSPSLSFAGKHARRRSSLRPSHRSHERIVPPAKVRPRSIASAAPKGYLRTE